ncbi:hypothetical protein DFQ28_006772 [Apophysomyces sp. BC1034]|nr:hypothetical protein DFQ30_004871 [Apophysomyces sp. BC1015]KAG0178717.1 hypothetical protein DFQ29_003082 [Apophysomyces sp. BC1021]KAG0193031.1 hypothetical protein DFQ28_006772 [Apophysomyces sp. BC1034]
MRYTLQNLTKPLHKRRRKNHHWLRCHCERFTPKIPFDTIVRHEFKAPLRRGVVNLCAFIREVVVRSQLFENVYVIDQNTVSRRFTQIPPGIRIAQLVMAMSITKSNPNLPEDVVEKCDMFRKRHPNIMYPLGVLAGYGSALPAALRSLRKAMPNFESGQMKAITFDYIYERTAGDGPV